jgi:hypothetical protein
MNNQSSRKSNPRRRRGQNIPRQISAERSSFLHPPMIENNPAWSGRLRYQVASNAAAAGITGSNLLNGYVQANTSTFASQTYNAYKLRAVEIWCPSNVSSGNSTPTTVAVQFTSTAGVVGSSGQNFSDTSVGIEPAHIFARPAKGSIASLWQQVANNVIFSISAPAGSIIDIHIDYKNILGLAGAGMTSSAMTPGATYFGSLDQIAKSTSQFPAVEAVLAA